MPLDRHLIEIIVEAHDKASKALNNVADAMDRLRDKAADVDKDMQRINNIHDQAAKAAKANTEAIDKETEAVTRATKATKERKKANDEYGKSIAPNVARSRAEIQRMAVGYTEQEQAAAFDRERRIRRAAIRLAEADGDEATANKLKRQSIETVRLNSLRRLENEAQKKADAQKQRDHDAANAEYRKREKDHHDALLKDHKAYIDNIRKLDDERVTEEQRTQDEITKIIHTTEVNREKLHNQSNENILRSDQRFAQLQQRQADQLNNLIRQGNARNERERIAGMNRVNAMEEQFERIRRRRLSASNIVEISNFQRRIRRGIEAGGPEEVVKGFEDIERRMRRTQLASGSVVHTLAALGSETNKFTRFLASTSRNLTNFFDGLQRTGNALVRWGRLLTPSFLPRWIGYIAAATVAVGIFGSAIWEASFALTAGLAAGIAQTLPIIGLLGLAFMRVSAVFKVMQLQTKSNTAEQRAHGKQLKQTSDAAWQLHQAQLALADAQKGVIDARRDALRNIQDLNDAEEQAITNAERAKLAFSDSARSLAESIKSGNFRDITSQQLDVADSHRNVGRSAIESARAQQDAARARKEGVAGNQQVIQALRAVADAEHQIAQAQQAKKTAAAGDPTQTLNLQDAKKQLDKTELGLLGAMTRLRDKWKTVGKQITDPIIKSFTDVVDSLIKLLDDPKVVGAAVRLSTAVGTVISDLAKFLTQPKQKSWFIDTMDAATKNLPIVEDILKRIVGLFEKMSTSGKPVLTDLLNGFKGLLGDFEKWANAPANTGEKKFGDDRATNKPRTNIQQLIIDGRKQLDALAKLMGSLGHLIQAIAGIFAEGKGEKGNTLSGIATQIDRLTTYINHHREDIKGSVTFLADWVGRFIGLIKRIYSFGQSKGELVPLGGLAGQIAGVTGGFISVGLALKFMRNPLRTVATSLGIVGGFFGTIIKFAKGFRTPGKPGAGGLATEGVEDLSKTSWFSKAFGKIGAGLTRALAQPVYVVNRLPFDAIPVYMARGGGFPTGGGVPGGGEKPTKPGPGGEDPILGESPAIKRGLGQRIRSGIKGGVKGGAALYVLNGLITGNWDPITQFLGEGELGDDSMSGQILQHTNVRGSARKGFSLGFDTTAIRQRYKDFKPTDPAARVALQQAVDQLGSTTGVRSVKTPLGRMQVSDKAAQEFADLLLKKTGIALDKTGKPLPIPNFLVGSLLGKVAFGGGKGAEPFPKEIEIAGTTWIRQGTAKQGFVYMPKAPEFKVAKKTGDKPSTDKQLSPREAATAAHHRDEGPITHPVARPVRGEQHDDVKPPDDKPTETQLDKIKKHYKGFATYLADQKDKTAKLFSDPVATGLNDAVTKTDTGIKTVKAKLKTADFASSLTFATDKLGPVWAKTYGKAAGVFNQIITGVGKVAQAFSADGKGSNFFDQLKLPGDIFSGPGALDAGTGLPRAAKGGMFGHVAGGRQITVGEGGHDEVVLSTDPRYARRSGKLLSQYLGKMNGGARYAQGGWVGKAQAAAELIDRKHFPYSWGGGHSDPPHPNMGHASSKGGPMVFGYDCSGAVSAVLNAAGLLKGAMVAAGFENYGDPGPGKVTIYANQGHTFMSIGGRGFGTGGDNPHGGAGWLPYNARDGFTVRHATGKQFKGGRGGGDDPEAIAAFLGLGKVSTKGVPGLIDYTKAIGPNPSRIAGQGPFRAVNERLWALAMRLAKKANDGGGDTSTTGDWAGVTGPKAAQGWIRTAMATVTAAGQRVAGDLWFRMLMRQAKNESGFNPNIANTTDINAQRGDPSIGLLQTTGSTFRAYALPGHGNIRNPVDNAIAAIRYMIAAYGKGNPGAAASAMWDRGGGAYAKGGELPGRLGKAIRVTAHAGEMIINRAQQAALGGTNYLRQKFGFGATRSSAKDGTYIEDRRQQFLGRGVGAGDDLGFSTPDYKRATDQIKKAAKAGLTTVIGAVEVLTSTFIGAKTFARITNQIFTQFANFKIPDTKAGIQKFQDYFTNFVTTIDDMATRLQHAQTVAASALTRRQFRVSRRGGQLSVVARSEFGAANVADQQLSNLTSDRDSLLGQQRQVNRGIANLRARQKLGGLSGPQRQALQADLNQLLTKHDELIGALSDNLTTAAQTLQDRQTAAIARIQERVAKVQGRRDDATALATARGEADTFQDPKALTASLKDANIRLEAQRKAAAKRGDTASVDIIKKQVADNRTQMAQLATDALNHTVQVAQDAFDQTAASQSLVQRKSQALGTTLGDDFYQTNIDAASKQMDALKVALKTATDSGATGVAAQIQTKIDDLNTSIVENTAQMIQAHIEATDKAFQDQLASNQQQSTLAALGLTSSVGAGGLLSITGGTLGRGPNLAAQGSALQARQGILTSQRAATAAELAWVGGTRPDDVAAIKDLTDKLNQNTLDLADNSQAILDNTHAVIDDLISRSQAQQDAQTGPLGSIQGYFSKLAQMNGATADNTAKQLELMQEQIDVTKAGTGRDVGILQQLLQSVGLGGLGSSLSGLSGQGLVQGIQGLISGGNFQSIFATLDDAQKQEFNSLINAILANESATLDLTTSMKDLQGAFTVQSFSSSAWQWFRNAVFTGMGQVLPQYNVPHMDTGGWITKSGIFHLEAGEAVRPVAGQSMGSQNIQLNIHQVKERVDPEEVSSLLAFKLKTTR